MKQFSILIISLIILLFSVFFVGAVSVAEEFEFKTEVPLEKTVCGNGICESGEDKIVIIGQTHSIPPSVLYGIKCPQDCEAPEVICSVPFCVGGAQAYKTGEVDVGGCPIYKCPIETSDCFKACICNGEKISCPTAIQKPIETEIIKENTEEPTKILIERKSDEEIIIKDNESEAITSEKITVEDSKLYIETESKKKEEIKILPEEAVSKTPEITQIGKIELKEESEKPVYFIKGTRKAKLLFMIPVTLNIETKIDAGTGEVISIKKPWWSFLVW